MRLPAAPSKHDIALLAAVGAFVADSVVNYFVAAPIFVLATPVLIVLCVLATSSKRDLTATAITNAIIATSLLLNVARNGVVASDLSDFLFLALAVSAIGAAASGAPSSRALSFSSAVFAALFIPAFFGVNNSFGNEDALTSGSNDLEFLRAYEQGMYRLPHLAAYMLAFGSVWTFMQWERERRARYALASLTLLLMCLYTGSRTPAFIFAVGVLAYYLSFSIKRILPLAAGAIFIVIFVSNIDTVLSFTEGTFLYQYPTAIKTALTNFERLSRVMIWTSWAQAMSHLPLSDYIIGASFSASLTHNKMVLGDAIWFHNDFLSIIYSYGAVAFAAYAAFLLRTVWVLVNSSRTRGAVVLGTFIIGAGIINGFYKYLPIVFLFALSSHFYTNKRAKLHEGE